ncbi:MAG TPA: hypothetical protein VF950_03805 [Planctomycetota bacterium]
MAPLLAAVLAQADPGMDAVRALLKLRDADGSWNSRPGDRGRALVALLTGGWSQLSKDEIDGVHMGDLIGLELARIAAAQRDDGLFYPEDPTANAWTALALTETYGLTGVKRWEPPARRAAEAVHGMPASDEDARFWQILVRVSAIGSRLAPKGPEPPPLGDAARQLMVAWWWRGVDLPHPAFDLLKASPVEIYVRDLSLWGGSHRRSEHAAWRSRVNEVLGGEGTVERAAFRALVVQTRNCWPCRNVLEKD